MYRSLPAWSRLFALGLVCSHTLLFGQELLVNGGFERASFVPWSLQEVSGASIKQFAENSPFSSGTFSVRIDDDDGLVDGPGLRQTFLAQSTILFAFDFKLLGASEQPSPWYVAWQGETNTTAFFFSLGGADGASLEFNQQPISALQTNLWYHIEGWASTASAIVKGSVTPSGGAKIDFSGGFPFNLQSPMNAVEVSDGFEAANPPILLDGFSTRALLLQVSRTASGEVVVSSPVAELKFQSSTNLSAPDWKEIPAAKGSYTNAPSDAMRFFRLVGP